MFHTKNECLFRNHQRVIVNTKDEHDLGDPLTRGNIGAPIANLFAKIVVSHAPGIAPSRVRGAKRRQLV